MNSTVFKPSSSKYDFVKVRVWLSRRHYYVLSRFLVSRVLTSIKVEYVHAIQIALELKKTLVDREALDITQSAMEQVLFHILQAHHYGDATIRLYHMVSSFHHQRIPLIIFIGGTACVGKSSLATQLAERLNLPSVVQTELIAELMMAMTASQSTTTDSLRRRLASITSQEELSRLYDAECALVRHGLQADLGKCMREGKSLIIEGIHVTTSLYRDLLMMASPATGRRLSVVNHSISPGTTDAVSDDQNDTVVATAEPMMIVTNWVEAAQPNETSPRLAAFDGVDNSAALATHPVTAIVIPFLLYYRDEAEHMLMIHDWLQHQPGTTPSPGQADVEMARWSRALQDSLQSDIASANVATIALPVNATSFSDTLDQMHDIVLDRLEHVFRQDTCT